MDTLLTSLRLEVLVVNRSALTTRWKCSLDNSPFARLYYVLGGEGFLHHHNQHFPLEPGHIYLIPPQSQLAYGCTDKIEIFWLHFTAELLGTVGLFDYLSCEYELVPAQTAHTFTRMSQLHGIYRQKQPNALLMTHGILLQLIAPFFRTTQTDASLERQEKIVRFMPILEYIDKNLDRRLDIPSLAVKAGLERAYFTALFADTFAIPPHKYINKRRIEKAQFLLARTRDKLEAIAGELGFHDAFHFSKTFRKFTGLSPSQYRTQRRQLQP